MRRICLQDLIGGSIMPKTVLVGIALMGLVASTVPAQAVDVALFFNNTYVDTSSGGNSAEAVNLEATLTGLGFVVTTFTGITAADFTAALAGRSVLAIPELENGDLGADLDAAARTVIASFVQGGGTLLVFDSTPGNTPSFLNAVFGFSVAGPGSCTGPISLNAAAAAGTSFASGPATLAVNNATRCLTTASLPPGSKSIYLDSGGETAVADIPSGGGHITFLAFDWFNAVPIGSQDGGWVSVLNTAGSGVAAIPTLSEWAMIVMAGLLVTLGLLRLRRVEARPAI